LFRGSPAIEPFTQKLVRSLPDSVEVVTLIDAPGLQLLTARREAAFNDDDLHARRALGIAVDTCGSIPATRSASPNGSHAY
jgi:hypothetical protein